MVKRVVYFDNAATSYPKPEGVIRAMERFSREVGASPGRSAHRLALEAGRIVFETREKISALFGLKNSSRVVLGMNATEGLNQGLMGLLRPGDHVITSPLEHNSVMRPLRFLEKEGLQITILPCATEGFLEPLDAQKAIRKNTKMVILNHGSNVVGTLQPLAEFGETCRKHGILFLVDAAQSAGAFPIDIEGDKIDLLAFTGHKALFGPQGTGGLIIGDRVREEEMIPMKRGGTGSRSALEEQPDFLPDLCESGTPNTVGLAGLSAGLDFIFGEELEKIREHERTLTGRLLEGLRSTRGIRIYGPQNAEKQLSTVSFNIEGISPSEAGLRLDEEYGILCRVGLHCSPASHRTLGTFPEGTVRFSMGYFNTPEEVDLAVQAVSQLSRGVV